MPCSRPTDEEVRNQLEGQEILLQMAGNSIEKHTSATVAIAMCKWFLGEATSSPPRFDIAYLERRLYFIPDNN